MAWFKNPFTDRLDKYSNKSDDISDLSDYYLKLDQTTPQTVVNGAPQFDEGVVIKANQKVYLDGL